MIPGVGLYASACVAVSIGIAAVTSKTARATPRFLPRMGTAQHGGLVPQHEHLGVLGG
jgi:hypothetical protein